MKKSTSKQAPRNIFFVDVWSIKISLILFVVNAFFITFVLLIKNHLPPELPIFYGFGEGEKQLVPNHGLMYPFILSGGLIIVNLGISFLTANKIVKQFLITTSFIVVIFSIVTVYKVISLVGSF